MFPDFGRLHECTARASGAPCAFEARGIEWQARIDEEERVELMTRSTIGTDATVGHKRVKAVADAVARQ